MVREPLDLLKWVAVFKLNAIFMDLDIRLSLSLVLVLVLRRIDRRRIGRRRIGRRISRRIGLLMKWWS